VGKAETHILQNLGFVFTVPQVNRTVQNTLLLVASFLPLFVLSSLTSSGFGVEVTLYTSFHLLEYYSVCPGKLVFS
jgi:hypothetical protein